MADNNDTPAAAAGGTTQATAAAAAPQTDNLIDTVAKPAAAPADGAPSEWFWADGVKGAEKPPEWFDGKKYKSVAEQAKAYPELFKKHGELASKLKGFTGAPEKYELSVPEDLKEQMTWSADDPLLSEFQGIAKEAGMSQEVFAKCLHTLAKYEYANMVPDWGKEKQLLGDRADERLLSFWDWAGANFDQETAGIVKRAMGINPSPGEVFMALEAVQGATRQPAIHRPDETVSASLTLADVDRMQAKTNEKGQRLFDIDPAYRDEVRAKRRQVVGDGDHKVIVGKKAS